MVHYLQLLLEILISLYSKKLVSGLLNWMVIWHGLMLASAAPSTSQILYLEGQILGKCESGQSKGQRSRKIRTALGDGTVVSGCAGTWSIG